eukprot:scaffold8113_cov85-Skeletonema_dohrnii-CCMP3373.AAC.4
MFWSTLEYSGVLESIPEYSGVLRSTPEYFGVLGVLESIPEYSGVFRSILPIYSKSTPKYSEVLRVLRSTPEYFGVQLLNISKHYKKVYNRGKRMIFACCQKNVDQETAVMECLKNSAFCPTTTKLAIWAWVFILLSICHQGCEATSVALSRKMKMTM